ncbi:HU family DNA-binding protein [bacterium]|nr:HU family DNA-binding protein [bacterium]MBQ7555949.1 HU family DNA-binding protein [bacterium]MBR5946496.1 HU family DNA-binding protein [bacterium]MBR6463165.1 HU family DNA-binding protein [bacterium]
MATKKAENLNKGLLVEDVVAATGLTKKQATAAVGAVLGSVQKTLKKGGKVAIVGFGTFATSKRKARKGINPKTKEQIKIAAKTVVKFKASSALLGK